MNFARRVAKLRHYAPILAREARHRLTPNADRIALVIPPAGVGSLGDEAMLQSIADHLDLLGCTHFRQLLMPRWRTFSLRGAELLRRRFDEDALMASTPEVLAGIRESAAVMAVGADVIDGRYGMQSVRYQLGFLQLAARCGIPAALLGHSISEKPDPEAIRLLAALPPEVSIYARDPVSRERFAAHTGRTPELVADLAFLVKPDESTEQHVAVRNWISRRRRDGHLLLCLNINGLTADDLSAGHGATVYWQRFILRLLQLHPSLSIILLSHDPRPEHSDSGMHDKVFKVLSAAVAERCLLVPDFSSAAQAKAVSMQADVVLTGRMHLAIGALSQGTPTYCVAYAGKFEGLARHIGVDEFSIPDADLAEPESAAAWFAARLPQLRQYRDALAIRLPQVMSLARGNFSFTANRSTGYPAALYE